MIFSQKIILILWIFVLQCCLKVTKAVINKGYLFHSFRCFHWCRVFSYVLLHLLNILRIQLSLRSTGSLWMLLHTKAYLQVWFLNTNSNDWLNSLAKMISIFFVTAESCFCLPYFHLYFNHWDNDTVPSLS